MESLVLRLTNTKRITMISFGLIALFVDVPLSLMNGQLWQKIVALIVHENNNHTGNRDVANVYS